MDRRPLQRSTKTARRLCGKTLGQTWPGLRLGRRPLALEALTEPFLSTEVANVFC
jgi:hypothetical protein